MLHLLTGTAGSGKTTRIHLLIKELTEKGKENLLLLVPEQFTHESDVGLVRTAGVAAAGNTEVFSFERLAESTFNIYGKPKLPQLGSCARAVFMAEALNELSDSLKVYGRHTDRPSFINGMLELTDELKKCSVSPEKLRKVSAGLEKGLLRSKTDEIAMIYETYGALISQSFFDSSDSLTLLCDIMDSTGCMKGRTVFLDGFRRFTGQEYKVLERILSQADEVYAAFCCDTVSIEPDEANAFTSIKTTVRKLTDLAKRCSVKIAPPEKVTDKSMGFSTYSSPELEYLGEALYSADAQPYDLPAPAITVCSARDVRDECDRTARTVKKLMRTEDFRCRDISVIYRSDGEYEREIKYAMKKYGVPVFEDERQPVTNQPLICLVRNLLSVCSEGLSTDAFLHIAKTSLTPLKAEEWSVLENYVFMWDINGNDWLREWEYNPDGFGEKMTDERRGRLEEINRLRKLLTDPVVRFRESCADATGRKICENIYLFLTENGCDHAVAELARGFDEKGESALALEQEQVWELFMDVLDQLACAMSDRPISLKRFASVLEIALSTQTLGRIPTGFDEVAVGVATRIQRRMSGAVFVLGMNDGVFPLPASSGGIFTDAERLDLESKSLEMAKNSRTHALDERFIVYNALCTARRKLFISYSNSDSAARLISKSETVARVEELFPYLNRVTSADGGIDLIESDESAFELMSGLWREKSDLSESLKEYFSSREDYAGKLEAIKRAADNAPFSMKKEQALKLFREHIYITPSKADTYEQCPFRYFCQYGIKASARKKAVIDPAQSGSIIHAVLEKMLDKHRANDIGAMKDEDIRADIHFFIVSYADELLGGYTKLPPRTAYLLDRMEKTLAVIIKRLGEEFSESSFTPCDFELRIGKENKIKEFRIELSGGRSISIYGIIDRVDLMRKNGKAYIRVVDYKSGPKEFRLSDVLNGLNMQMLMYLIALWTNGQERYGGEIVPCGVFYLPARFTPFDDSRGKTDDELMSTVISAGKMNGLVLNDADAVDGMSAGDFTFLPIKKKADGTLSGNFIDIVSMARLRNKISDILRDMAENLHSGNIPAKPVYGKKYENVCEYCDYASVCCHEDGGERRIISYTEHDECIEKMKEDESSGT